MNDITILYCTASLLKEDVAQRVRDHLLKVTEGKIPIVSVSQKPLKFGKNVCVGEIGQSCYNFFKQMYLGALYINTPYIAHVDDDCLYVQEHFKLRPKDPKAFLYNNNSWINSSREYWRKEDRYGMFCTISPTQELLKNLSARLNKYPTKPKDDHHWGEPGKFDTEFGIPNAKIEVAETKIPLIRFEFRGSLNGKMKRYGIKGVKNIKPYGDAVQLRKEFGFE